MGIFLIKKNERKATTAKSKYKPSYFDDLKKDFLDELDATVKLEEIPPELILNWDQTGIKIVPSSSWSMEKFGSKKVEVVGVGDKRVITACFCGSFTGDFLPIQVIYKGTTTQCHPHYRLAYNSLSEALGYRKYNARIH